MKYIYLISSEFDDTILYKIGYTKRSVQKRIKELETGNPYDFDIVQVFEAENYGSSIETKLHKHFKYKQIKSEWFCLSTEDINEFQELCNNFYNLFDLLKRENSYIQDKNIDFL